MPAAFSIIPESDGLSLVNGRGEISFAVSNTSGRPVRGQAILEPLGATEKVWLSLAGESERDFSAGQDHEYVVHLAVPEGTSPGDYQFRLNIVSVTNPQEESAKGPVVTATSSAPRPVVIPVKDEPPPPRRWWIVLAILAALLLGGLAVWFALRPTQPPPEPPLVVTSVAVAASPTKFSGACPANVKFTGTIQANKQGQVTYQTLIDGKPDPQVQTVTTKPDGTFSWTWIKELGQRRSIFLPAQTTNHAAVVEVTAPNVLRSEPVNVAVTCQPILPPLKPGNLNGLVNTK